MSINEVTLGDPTEPARPFEQTLAVSAVGDLAFVSVVRVEEGNPATTTTVLAEMTVSLPTLRDTLILLCQDRDRERLRPSDERGNGLPDLAGTRYTVTPA